MEAKNFGQQTPAPDAIQGSAFDLKALHRKLRDLPDDVLQRIRIVAEGEPLEQGATYTDLSAPELGEFTARGDVVAGPGSSLVPKAAVDYETWNLLLAQMTSE
jgi:hypothetical protein